ncbi:MAG: helix-turn-helix domain-containing protein [Oculatellaceae cyanobacterium Prado106]|jgi:transposase|nr:helix-turn-helix domain-containing protein [Oculatellaceae cyanobacterium Prado106]
MEELTEFIQSNPDPRELRRALAVRMVLQKYTYLEIREVLQVSIGFISKWKHAFEEKGVSGLALQHHGSKGYLDAQQRQSVMIWLQQNHHWNLSELQRYIQEAHGVTFASNQSYYQLFADAGILSKKHQDQRSAIEFSCLEQELDPYDAWINSDLPLLQQLQQPVRQ